MSDRPTPETDAEIMPIANGFGVWMHVVPADFARDLERKLAEAKKSAKGLADAMVRYAHQRDAYAETLRVILTDCTERCGLATDYLRETITERHPELAENA